MPLSWVNRKTNRQTQCNLVSVVGNGAWGSYLGNSVITLHLLGTYSDSVVNNNVYNKVEKEIETSKVLLSFLLYWLIQFQMNKSHKYISKNKANNKKKNTQKPVV